MWFTLYFYKTMLLYKPEVAYGLVLLLPQPCYHEQVKTEHELV